MARYRQKDQTDLVWNSVRRRITRELDIAIADERERILNDLLGGAWTEFSEALGEGKLPELQSKYSQLVTAIVSDALPKLEVSGDESDLG